MSLPKLVRDKIPGLIENSGKFPLVEKAEGAELSNFIFAKLHEEIKEFKDDPSLEEAADIYEAFLALCENFKMNVQDVLLAAENKRLEKGSFKKSFILKSVN